MKAGVVALAVGAAFAFGLALVVLIALFRPAFFTVRRSITIDAPAQRVFDLLQDLRQWERWSAWPLFSPAIDRSFNRHAAGWGAGFTWHDKRRHARGAVDIVALTAPTKLVLELGMPGSDDVPQLFEFTLRPVHAGATEVQWVFRGPAPLRLRLAGVWRSLDKRFGNLLSADLERLRAAACPGVDAPGDARDDTAPGVLALAA